MPTMSDGWIQLNSGRKWWVLNPKVEDVDPVDVFHALAGKPRFGAHTDRHFTVGQHLLIVVKLVPPEYAYEGLVHDAPEFVIPDVPSPMKPLIVGFKDFEDNTSRVVHARFRVPYPFEGMCKWEIKRADWISVLMEHRLGFNNHAQWECVPYGRYDIDKTLDSYDPELWLRIQRMSQEDVKNALIRTFKDLAKERFGNDCLPDFFPHLKEGALQE
jgi:5'-deoxynucleotidase YfbR-like HD superfamily hydrolase